MNWRLVFSRMLLPTAVLTFHFLVPVSASDAPVGTVLGFVVGAVCLAAVAGAVFNEVRQAAKRLRAVHLLLAFELVLVIFSFGYFLLTVQQPGQFNGLTTRLDALYFSMTTMSTVGYGDIHAEGQLARLLVTVQLVFNLVFVASLVSLFQDQIRRGGAREWLRPRPSGSTQEPPVEDEARRHP
ncbi:two pore domain potassium channel family protein [Tessaracoccus sp. MC1679]|uniref:potassium channel family protein n=1 Tax=Tessaracoccus sp. MC1679 TaxID=2760313 RepID=UPI0016007E7D|nr:two pore domain potassium channel family protein [Tessaracoccus sp. MC1679]